MWLILLFQAKGTCFPTPLFVSPVSEGRKARSEMELLKKKTGRWWERETRNMKKQEYPMWVDILSRKWVL